MKFIELNKNLKEKVENVYNIIGEDTFLIKQAILNLKSNLIKDFEDFNFIKVDAEKIKSSEADAILSTLPMANDFRLVVLTKPNSEVVKVINSFNFENSGIVIACINADKLANATTIDCGKLDRSDIVKYVLHNLAKANLSIEEQALEYLIEACSHDMSKISNELNKIISYCANEHVVTIDVVTNLVSNSSEYAIYNLTNAIDNKDFTAFQKILNEMAKSESKSEIFSFMGKYFKRMQYVALNKNDDEVAKFLNIKPFAVKKSRDSVKRNGVKFYINLYQKYVDLDYLIKSGKISVDNALYEIIF